MASHDGNGWVDCRCGQRHWGRFGAAGLLLLHPDPTGDGWSALMQLRAEWTHQGGLWGLPGGARDSHEDVVAAALREAWEEVGAHPDRLRVLAEHPGVDHGDWSYTYVLAVTAIDQGTASSTGPDTETDTDTEVRLGIGALTAESAAVSWVGLDEVATLGLHPALGSAWPALLGRVRALLTDVTGDSEAAEAAEAPDAADAHEVAGGG